MSHLCGLRTQKPVLPPARLLNPPVSAVILAKCGLSCVIGASHRCSHTHTPFFCYLGKTQRHFLPVQQRQQQRQTLAGGVQPFSLARGREAVKDGKVFYPYPIHVPQLPDKTRVCNSVVLFSTPPLLPQLIRLFWQLGRSWEEGKKIYFSHFTLLK